MLPKSWRTQKFMVIMEMIDLEHNMMMFLEREISLWRDGFSF